MKMKKKISFNKEIIKNLTISNKRFASSLIGKKKDLQNVTIGQFLSNQSEKNPYKDWLRYCPIKDLRYTFDEFNGIIDKLAIGLIDARGKDVFTSFLENDYNNLVTQFACARANIKYAFLPPKSGKETVRKALESTESRGLLTNSRYRERDNLSMIEEMIPFLSEWPFGVPLKVKQFPNLKLLIQTGQEYRAGFLSLRDLSLRDGINNPLPSLQPSIQPGNVASIFFGEKGGVSFSHTALINNSLYLAELLGLKWEDRILVDLPFWESYGQTAGILTPYSSQSLVVIASTLFNEENTLKKLYEENINTLFCTPSQALLLLQHPNFSKFRKDTLKKLLVVSTSSDRATPQLLASLRQSFATEDVHLAFSVDHFAGVSFHANSLPANLSENSTPAGYLLPNMEAKIVDESGKVVPEGTKGTLFLKGHNLFSGYINANNLDTPTLDSQGFFNTNLQASVDTKGFFTVF